MTPAAHSRIRVVIADDSSLARAMLRDFLESDDGIEVVGEATNGRQAVDLARDLKPDLITMDIEMPVMTGLEAIDTIMRTKALPILVVTSVLDAHNALEAVGRGALDAMSKPDFTRGSRAEFVAKVRLLAGVAMVTRMGEARTYPLPGLASGLSAPQRPAPPRAQAETASALRPEAASGCYSHVFAIASSTGGPQALACILSALPNDFSCPVVIAQHISEGFAPGMAKWLSGLCKLPVRLAVEGEPLRGGEVLVSPSERHLSVSPRGRVALVACKPTDVFHPSCDLLLSSVAEVFRSRSVGIILTGMSNDGVKGLARIREQGGATMAQDEATSVVYGMNRMAIEAGLVRRVLPIDAIAGAMASLQAPPPARDRAQ